MLTYSHRTRGVTDVSATFSYDASGQRTKSVVTTPAGTTTTSYVYEGLQLFRVVAADPSKTTTLTYLYDELGRPSLLAGQVSTSPGQTYFLRVGTTERGDVVNLTDCNNNGGGSVLAGYAYDIYGNVATSTPVTGSSLVPLSVAQAIAAAQPLRYAGYAYDSFSGLYYCSQRYFDPATFQFISADPVGADGEQSEYQYCGGDPVNHMDPSGLMMDFFDTGQANSTGAAHEALIHARAKALRAKLRARMLASAKRERAQKARETAAHVRARKAAAKAAAARAKAEAEWERLQATYAQSEAQAYAEAAQTTLTAVGRVLAVVGIAALVGTLVVSTGGVAAGAFAAAGATAGWGSVVLGGASIVTSVIRRKVDSHRYSEQDERTDIAWSVVGVATTFAGMKLSGVVRAGSVAGGSFEGVDARVADVHNFVSWDGPLMLGDVLRDQRQ